jgi:Putative prokaryotic signal transducing protein
VTDLVEAARFETQIEADLARLYLGSEGIEAVLFDTGINGIYGGLFLPVRLMVLADDLASAQSALGARP